MNKKSNYFHNYRLLPSLPHIHHRRVRHFEGNDRRNRNSVIMSALQQLDNLIAELEAVVGNRASSCGPPAVKSKKAGSAPTSIIPPASPATDDDLTVNSLDLRVGIIRSVTRHETAEKLYCEEIDVGEAEPRPIASGLVPYYSLEQMQNRKVIVICNLPPRKLVGFKSNGMVLCASSEAGGVEFVDVPVSAQPGERIVGLGLVGEALSQKQCDKRKAFEKIAEGLKINQEGKAEWNGVPLVARESGEACTAPTLRDVPIR